MFDTKANCNKFYHAQLLDDLDTVEVRYGRVGNDGVKHTYTGGERKYNQMLRSKRTKGYKDAMIAAEVDAGGVTVQSNVIETALKEIKYLDDKSRELVMTISQQNIHRITASTSIKFDSDDGLFKTPLGVIQQHGVEKAIVLLGQIEEEVAKFTKLSEADSEVIVSANKKRKREADGPAEAEIQDLKEEVKEEQEEQVEVVEPVAEPAVEPAAQSEEPAPPSPKRRRTRARAAKTKNDEAAEQAKVKAAEEAKAAAEAKAAKAAAAKAAKAAKAAATKAAKAAKAAADAAATADPSDPVDSPVTSPELAEVISKLYSLNEEYFVIIPNKVKNAREIEHLLFSQTAIDEQKATCDALLETLKLIEDLKNKAEGVEPEQDVEKTFDVELKHVTNKKTFNKINKMFETSKNAVHGYYTSTSKVSNIYEVKLGSQQEPFAKTSKEIKCVQQLWHGTRLQNILSIMGKGLLLPKLSPGQKVGAMFGDGLYFANQSSKSLNYCDGLMYTGGGSKPSTIYMFMASVALGNYFTPSGPVSDNPPEGYHSYWAKAKESGVMNDEIIVFDGSQVRLDYLLEIELSQ